MNLDKSCQLFFGCKIDSKLREALHHAKPGERKYFEDANSEFLRILVVRNSEKEEKWIGKVTKGGLNLTEIEDTQRNVLSILRRIASGVRISPSSVKLYVIAPETENKAAAAEQPAERGPYIANY